jgi:hypothetical protein
MMMINYYLRAVAAVKLTAIRHSRCGIALSCETFLNFLISHANTFLTSSSSSSRFTTYLPLTFLCSAVLFTVSLI